MFPRDSSLRQTRILLARFAALVRAKSLLRDRHGLSEEQAYVLLRNRSRSSRKRLREVAQETISQSNHWLTEKREGVGV